MKINEMDIWKRIADLTPGIIIPKPQAKADFKVKGLGRRRDEEALIYTIPNHKNPASPYQKGITKSEWQQAFNQLVTYGEFSRSWFQDNMPACAYEGGCNFTTIGGIFEILKYAIYDSSQSRYCAQ